MKLSLGRCVYGAAVIAYGICAFAYHDISNWVQLKAVEDLPHKEILAYIVGVIEILGGAAVLWPRSARAGAAALGALYFIFALLGMPFVIEQPLVYNGYGNVFEVLSFVAGALIIFACSGQIASARTPRFAQIGYYLFGFCVLSFALEQLFYLAPTASLVPKWIPPGQMFWAITTTAAFALASIALLTGFMARLASQLNTAMIVGFGLLVWLPALFADPHSFVNWTEGIETLGIAGSAWILADYLGRQSSTEADSSSPVLSKS